MRDDPFGKCLRRPPLTRARGYSAIEIILVVAIMAILVMAAQPYVHLRARQHKELELERKLRTMRAAIDRYHDYAVLGLIEPWDLDWNFYPEEIETLVEGVEVKFNPEEEAVVIRFLREIPVDPLTGEAEWACRGYEDDPDERSSSCEDVYDVFSTSIDSALDGSYYADW